MKKELIKILPYLLIVIGTVIAIGIVDKVTETGDHERDKQELVRRVEFWRNKYIKAEKVLIILDRKINEITTEIEGYETDNDSIIADIRDAREARDFARLDRIGDDLLERLRSRR